MTRLVEAGIVAPTGTRASTRAWSPTPSSSSSSARGTRRGSRRWDDLTKEGVEVVTPNPFTSGGARWNVMAGYGAQLEQGESPDEAREYLRTLFANVVVQDKSARESLTTFAAGKGDVLLAYENEAIFAQRQGQPFEYVVPDQTILIENPVAATKDASAAGKGFVEFLLDGRGAEDLRRRGLPARLEGRPRHVRLPGAAVALHDRRRRRLGHRPEGVLRPRDRLHGRRAARARPADRVALTESDALGAGCGGSGQETNVRPVSR